MRKKKTTGFEAVAKQDLADLKLELASDIHDVTLEMKRGFLSVQGSLKELSDLLRPTARALDATLLDIRDLKRRVARLEKQSGLIR